MDKVWHVQEIARCCLCRAGPLLGRTAVGSLVLQQPPTIGFLLHHWSSFLVLLHTWVPALRPRPLQRPPVPLQLLLLQRFPFRALPVHHPACVRASCRVVLGNFYQLFDGSSSFCDKGRSPPCCQLPGLI